VDRRCVPVLPLCPLMAGDFINVMFYSCCIFCTPS